MQYYDAAQHSGDTGHALWDLGVHGHFVPEARGRLATAVVSHGVAYRRSRAISQTKLASLVMVAGDPVEAASIGMAALDAAGTIRSRRAADDLLALRDFATRHRRTVEVEELRHRIRTVVSA
ncbi:hypothetical protein [Streptoalloteichus hindustanus]|uniref:hypothetical protein n=1 Tax=Streptoalloteichus hindustanus TaxID=2017 RepID=UPI001F2A6619|nr:hypothetical protein [Streptoalloteichus hindustanus]